MNVQTKHLDHLGIVAGICDPIELVQPIDAFFPKQARKVSVGEATKAMILNALGFVSRPMSLSSELTPLLSVFTESTTSVENRHTMNPKSSNFATACQKTNALISNRPSCRWFRERGLGSL